MRLFKQLMLPLLLALAFPLTVLAGDSYFVIHIKGTVTSQKTGKPVKVGDQINSEEQLKFGSGDAVVVLMGSKGKFTISPSVQGDKPGPELLAYVNSAILPLKSNGHLSTRGSEQEAISDLKNYFGSNKFYIIGNQLTITIDSLKYPLNEKQVFIFRYIHNGAVVSKKINSRGSRLIIDRKALYTLRGTVIDPEQVENVDIYYYNTHTKTSSRIVNFSPHFINEEVLKEELKVQQRLLREQQLSQEQIDTELLWFVTDVYGPTDEPSFRQWIKTNIPAE